MKIEPGKIYIHKVTKSKVVVNSIEGTRISVSEIGSGKVSVKSKTDFELKYKLAIPPKKKRN